MFEGTGLTWDEIMVQCLDLVCSADAVILLPGWKHSRGAQMELGAAYALRLPVYEYHAGWSRDHIEA
jgi:nucleoside 2-deoxyribosyltransferase